MTRTTATQLIASVSLLASLLTSGLAIAQATTPNSTDKVTEVTVTGQQNPSAWFRAESSNFIVYSDASQEDVSLLLDKLERFDQVLRLYVKIGKDNASKQKTTLYYLAKVRNLNVIDPERAAYSIGLVNSCELGVQSFGAHMYFRQNTDKPIEQQAENEGLVYIFEAHARHFLYRYTNMRAPTWYIDGFAQYFASTRFNNTEALVGLAPKSIGEYLAMTSSGDRALDYSDILLQKDFKNFNHSRALRAPFEFQARSWILMHYILSSPENLEKFRRYLALEREGVETIQAFEQVFGFKVSKMRGIMWKYAEKNANALKFTLPAKDMAEIQFSPLPASADDLLFADAALKTCPSPKIGNKLLQTIRTEAKKFPHSEFAEFALSRAEIVWGNPQAAVPFLTAQAKKNNAEALYLLGLANLTMAKQMQAKEQVQGEEQKKLLAAAQDYSIRAFTLNQQSAEAIFTFFKAGMQAEATPANDTLGAAVIAAKLQPEVSSYKRAAALTHAYLNQLPETATILNTLATNSREPKMAAWATTWQAKLKAGASRADILAEMRLDPTPYSSFKEWTMSSAETLYEIDLAAGSSGAAAEEFLREEALNYKRTE